MLRSGRESQASTFSVCKDSYPRYSPGLNARESVARWGASDNVNLPHPLMLPIVDRLLADLNIEVIGGVALSDVGSGAAVVVR